MESQLTPEQQVHLTPLLGSLARLIAQDTPITARQIDVLLSATDLEDHPAAGRELHRWARLLQSARDAEGGAERQVVVEGLLLRGLPEAAVLLAVETVRRKDGPPPPAAAPEHSALRVNPERLDWSLSAQQPAEGALEVEGGPGQVIVESDQVEVRPLQFGAEPTRLQVRVRPVAEGLVWSKLRLITARESVEVPLVAQWHATATGSGHAGALWVPPASPTSVTITAPLPESPPAPAPLPAPPIYRRESPAAPQAAPTVPVSVPPPGPPLPTPARSGGTGLLVIGGLIAVVCLLGLGGLLFGQRGAAPPPPEPPTITGQVIPPPGDDSSAGSAPSPSPTSAPPTEPPILPPTDTPVRILPPTDTPLPPAVPTATPIPPPLQAVALKMLVIDYTKGKTPQWLTNEVIPAYQQAHPNISIQVVYADWSTLDKTLRGYFTAGDGADILHLGSEYAALYGNRLAPLNSYLSADTWPEIQNYLPASLETVTRDGQLRGLPWLIAPRAYMCRNDWVQTPSTYQEAITAARETTLIENNTLKRAGIVISVDWQEYIQLIWGLGIPLYRGDGTPNFDSREAQAALQFMHDRRRAVYPTKQVSALPTNNGSRLADGTAACIWGSLIGAPPLGDPLWSKISLAASPINPDFPNSRPVVPVFTDWLGVAGYSPHIGEAVDFLKFLGSAENLNRFNGDAGFIPPRQDAWTGYMTDPVMQQVGQLVAQSGVSFSDVRESDKLRTILSKQMSAYFTDAQSLDTTLASIQQQYITVLRDAGWMK
jgi:multiple sugar transport system substrate-binding protein